MLNDAEIEKLVQTAVNVAVESKLENVDEKIQAALNLGATLGAKAGAEIGAAAAIKAIEREQKNYQKRNMDHKLHNTKLLLRNYRTLQAHYRHAVFDVDTAEEESEDFAKIINRFNSKWDDDMCIESIKESCRRTKIIMTHVNNMLNIYMNVCNSSDRLESKRHWRVLYNLYLCEQPMTVEEIAKSENIGERTVYKDIKSCVDDLTILFFGYEGLKNV